MLRKVHFPTSIATTGNLYLCSMPGRFEPLEEFLHEAAEAKITHILCLVSDQEIAIKSPHYLMAIQNQQIPANILRFTIPDYGTPSNPDELDAILDLIYERLKHGESIAIHCAYGHGRTGIASTLLLARMGLPLVDAIQVIHDAGSGSDTAIQREFLTKQITSWNR